MTTTGTSAERVAPDCQTNSSEPPPRIAPALLRHTAKATTACPAAIVEDGVSVPFTSPKPCAEWHGWQEYLALAVVKTAPIAVGHEPTSTVALTLVALQAAFKPHSIIAVGALAAGGLAGVFASYWFVWFDRSEQVLVHGLLRREAGKISSS